MSALQILTFVQSAKVSEPLEVPAVICIVVMRDCARALHDEAVDAFRTNSSWERAGGSRSRRRYHFARELELI